MSPDLCPPRQKDRSSPITILTIGGGIYSLRSKPQQVFHKLSHQMTLKTCELLTQHLEPDFILGGKTTKLAAFPAGLNFPS